MSIESRHGVDKPGYEPPSQRPAVLLAEVGRDASTRPRYAITPFSLGLLCVAAAGLTLSVFLPFNEATGQFSTVRNNTLIQQGGWPFLAIAAYSVLAGYYSSSAGRRGWGPIIAGVCSILVAVQLGTDKALRTLYPLSPNGTPETSQHGIVASLGVAVYLAGAMSVLMVIAGIMMRQSPRRDVPSDATLDK
jgi:uncharacterized membrane protein YfcA